MRNLCLLFLVGLATGVITEKLPLSQTDDLYISSGDFPLDDEDNQDGVSGSGSGDNDEAMDSWFHKTTFSKEVVPVPPQSTADSPRNPPSTAAEQQDQTTTVKTTAYIFPDWGNRDLELPEAGTTPDWLTASTSPSFSEMPPSETTDISEGFDLANSLDENDILEPKDGKDEGLATDGNEIVSKDGRGSRRYELGSSEEVTSENMWERTEVLAAVIACGVVGFLCAVFLLLLLAYRMKKKDEGSYALGDTKLSTTAYHKAPTKEFYA